MKKILISIGIIILIILVGCFTPDLTINESTAKTDRFVKIQTWGNNFVMYDKETKVQYYAFGDYKVRWRNNCISRQRWKTIIV